MSSQLIQKQRDYFCSGATIPISVRKQRLETLKRLVIEHSDELCDATHKDLRRNPILTKMLEIGNVMQEIDYTIANLEEWSKPTHVERTFANALDQTLISKDPLGVVLIMAPWNYPVSLILLPVIPAIAAGNTVVIKPSEVSANVANTFEKLIPKFFDPEFCAVVSGGIPETTELLKQRFDHILYTGSPEVGKVVMAAASKNLTPVTLELGGKCPVFVDEDVDFDLVAKRIAWGKWLNCGQTCLAPDYIICNKSTKEKLINSFTKVIKEFYGNDIQSSNDYSRIINTRHFDRISGILDRTKGKILFKGGVLVRDDNFIPPVILDVEKSDAFMEDEIFGPVLPILTVDSLSEAVEYINNREKPLAAYVFSKSEKNINHFVTEVRCGGITVNDVIMHITVDTLPFGGVGNSGMGRYRGKYGFDTFTHEKSVLKRGFFGESLQGFRYPPVTQKKLETMQMVAGKRIRFPKNFGTVGNISAVFISLALGMATQKYIFQS